MKNIPKKIYLQIEDSNVAIKDFRELNVISWCEDKINANDIEYTKSNNDVDTEIASESITNALYATGSFSTDQCDQLAEGILQYIKDAGLVITKKN